MKCYTIVSMISIVLLLASMIEAITPFDSGAGDIYTLRVTQDVSLERGSTNYDYLEYLIVGTHLGYPLKRSLLQFQDLPCSCENITWAKMYVHFAYAHKPSFRSVSEVPYISRPLQAHQVKRQWSECQATSTIRLSGQPWSQPWLALNGSDADPIGLVSDPVTIYTGRPGGFIEIDITRAMRNWKSGDPNFGVVLLATNENELGRDIRFFSNASGDSSKHAYVNVLCN